VKNTAFEEKMKSIGMATFDPATANSRSQADGHS
jgi:hypothetical protein